MADERLRPLIAQQPYPLIFASLSGAHLYGFPSPDSDYDVRGVHVLPAREVLGLDPERQTIEISRRQDGLDVDLVTHDVKKFMTLLLKPNGYVLEQLFSPLVLQTTPEHDELRAIASSCITVSHARHYLAFADNQWRLFESDRRLKRLLYVYRVVLTGTHLMRTGQLEANLEHLNGAVGLSYLDELMARKRASEERVTLEPDQLGFYRREYSQLREALSAARDASSLPTEPQGRAALNDLLVRLRLQ
jgi:hypothetical protein